MSGPRCAGLLRITRRRRRCCRRPGRRCPGRSLNWRLPGVDLEVKPGVEKTSAGRCVASVLAMISLANELFSSSVRKFRPGGALQVVEAVAVLQLLQLLLEHEVEGRAEHAAEGHLLLGQAADPEVDVVEAGGGLPSAVRPGAGAVQEGEPVGRRRRSPPNTSSVGRGALAVDRGRREDGRVRAVGGDEVDQRFRVLQVLHEVDPARVGLEAGVAGDVVELAPRRVQRRNRRCRGRARC